MCAGADCAIIPVPDFRAAALHIDTLLILVYPHNLGRHDLLLWYGMISGKVPRSNPGQDM